MIIFVTYRVGQVPIISFVVLLCSTTANYNYYTNAWISESTIDQGLVNFLLPSVPLYVNWMHCLAGRRLKKVLRGRRAKRSQGLIKYYCMKCTRMGGSGGYLQNTIENAKLHVSIMLFTHFFFPALDGTKTKQTFGAVKFFLERMFNARCRKLHGLPSIVCFYFFLYSSCRSQDPTLNGFSIWIQDQDHDHVSLVCIAILSYYRWDYKYAKTRGLGDYHVRAEVLFLWLVCEGQVQLQKVL